MTTKQVTGTIARHENGERVEGIDFFGDRALGLSMRQVMDAPLKALGLSAGEIDVIAAVNTTDVLSRYPSNRLDGEEIVDIKNRLHLTIDFA